MLSFDQALGAELKDRGITVTSVCPGPVDTEFFQTGGIALSPLKKIFLAKPQKVVKKALFDAEAGKGLSLGRSMKLLRLLGSVLPQKLILEVMRKLFL